MTTPAAPAAPASPAPATPAAPATGAGNGCPPIRKHPCCFIGDDRWHQAETRIELPPETHLEAYWHAEILDYQAKNPLTRIIERREDFVVRFRVELVGRLWNCICGHWCFNVGFTPVGRGEGFDLSEHLPDPGELEYGNWTGCQTLCIERCVTVPACAIPADRCGTVYEVAAWFELRCCGGCRDKDSHLAVSGFEKLGDYQFV
jgi:hypothetical protein